MGEQRRELLLRFFLNIGGRERGFQGSSLSLLLLGAYHAIFLFPSFPLSSSFGAKRSCYTYSLPYSGYTLEPEVAPSPKGFLAFLSLVLPPSPRPVARLIRPKPFPCVSTVVRCSAFDSPSYTSLPATGGLIPFDFLSPLPPFRLYLLLLLAIRGFLLILFFGYVL